MNEELLNALLGMLAAVIAAATPIVAAYVVKWFRKKMEREGIEISGQQAAQLQNFVLQGIQYAAQKAKVQAKNGTGEKMPSSEKLQLAAGLARALAKSHGIPEERLVNVEDLIESALSGMGAVNS